MNLQKFSFFAFLTLFLVACSEDPAQYTYQEIYLAPPAAAPISEMQGHAHDHDEDFVHPPIPEGMSLEELGLSPAPSEASAEKKVVWTLPEGWSEKLGTGMRLATFNTPDNALEGSVISLAGMAGGLEANVTRWMGQISLPTMGAEELHQFIEGQSIVQTGEGRDVQLVDLSSLQSGDENPSSMFAGVIASEGETIFIKFSGAWSAIEKNREKIIKLCQSFELNK